MVTRMRTASEAQENERDTSTLSAGNYQRVHNFQERVARQTLCVTADSIQSNESSLWTRFPAELRTRAARLCWVYKESQIVS